MSDTASLFVLFFFIMKILLLILDEKNYKIAFVSARLTNKSFNDSIKQWRNLVANTFFIAKSAFECTTDIVYRLRFNSVVFNVQCQTGMFHNYVALH